LAGYYGAYSNVSRGKRKKEKVEEKPAEVTEVPSPPISRELKRRWSHFIRKVYETDPLFFIFLERTSLRCNEIAH